jgi:hypothetical protein
MEVNAHCVPLPIDTLALAPELDDPDVFPEPLAASADMAVMVAVVAAFNPDVAEAMVSAVLTVVMSCVVHPGVFMAKTKAFCNAVIVADETPLVPSNWARSVCNALIKAVLLP